MDGYTIGEIAERSGFSASTLRYYEEIGLVAPASRTDAGYRQYDDETLVRLAFIARAKHLGCTLDEIADLIRIWDGETCAPVQRQFHELVTAKIGAAHLQLAELTAFTAQLQETAALLGTQPADGPCDEHCACIATPAAKAELPRIPIACTLERDAMPSRMHEWQALLAGVEDRTEAADGALRLELGPDTSPAELMRLVAAEQRCCAFFEFAITVDHRGLGLEVRAPADAGHIVTALFGAVA